MYNFGPNPPRALMSFGVSGLLEDSCKVFYDNLFSTRHVGRVSDLLAAKLKEAGLDELKLRAILLFGIFEGYCNPGISSESASQVMVECGLDSEKIAVGFSFNNMELAQKLAKKESVSQFVALITIIQRQADRVLIRVLAETGKVEIIAILGIPGKVSKAVLEAKGLPETLVLDRASTVATPQAEFIQLGDLDFPKLLREDNPVAKLPPSVSGTMVSGVGAPEQEPEIRFAGEREESLKRKIGGTTDTISAEKIAVAGATGPSDESLIRVQGGSPGDGSDPVTVVGGGSFPGDDPALDQRIVKEFADRFGVSPEIVTKIHEHFRNEASGYRNAIARLEQELREARAAGLAAANAGVPAGSIAKLIIEPSQSEGAPSPVPIQVSSRESVRDSEPESGLSAMVPKFLKKAWPFSKTISDEKQPSTESESGRPEQTQGVAGGAAKANPVTSAVKSAPNAAPPVAASASDDLEAMEEAEIPVSNTIEPLPDEQPIEQVSTESLDRAVTKAAKESVEIKKEIASDRAKHWVDGMMGEILAEKALLVDKAKSVNAAIRHKELEFKNRQAMLIEELRRRDEAIRQRENQVLRLKSQLAELTIAAERGRGGSSSIEAVRSKQKAEMAQKMLKTVKAENTSLVSKIEDLRSQLASVAQASKASSVASSELSTMRIRFDHVNRQCEEFKKANHLLSEKLALVKREKAQVGGGNEDLKRKLELAMQTAAAHQRDAEEYRLKSEELKREEVRLKMELGRAQTEIKALKQSVLKIQKAVVHGSTGGSGGSKAA